MTGVNLPTWGQTKELTTAQSALSPLVARTILATLITALLDRSNGPAMTLDVRLR